MAIKAGPATAGLGAAERFATHTLRFLSEFTAAVGEGFRARNEYCARISHGADPANAASAAVRDAALH